MKKSITFLVVATMFTTIIYSQCIPDITTGLKADYQFNGNANDTSGKGGNGIVNNATLTTDRFGNANSAYLFDGTSSYIDLGVDTAINNIKANFSISYWSKMNTGGPGRTTIISSYGNSIWRFIATQWYNGQIEDDFYTTGWQSSVTGPSVFNINQWNNIVYTNNSGISSIYVNNVITYTASVSTFTMASIGASTAIGYNFPSTSNYEYFNGSLDEIKIYNRVLTACDIDSLYNTGNTQTTGIKNISGKDFNLFTYGNIIKTSSQENLKLKIFDLYGSLLFNGTMYQSITTDLPNGVYLIQTTDNKGNVYTKKSVLINNQ